ncbi:MAG: FAD:protein FMN transferase, partial [Flavobacteriales bacterium]|nr:FAD:protein FMN transferase [Flavobacteriales bacterium]
FEMALKIAHETNGLFEPTIAPLVNFWGFGFEEISNKNENILVNLMQSVGYKKIRIKDGHIIKENPNTLIDFNAIAQGFTVDLIGEHLQKIGLTNYMIEIGGELKCSGLNADEKPWRIGIDKPSEEIQKERHLAIIEVSNKSVASSGNYRKLKIDQETGIKYAHTINPKTGMPTLTDLLSVTIVSESCMQADAIATACMVMGKEKSINYIISKPQIDALLIYSGPKGEWIKYQTEGFKKMRIY